MSEQVRIVKFNNSGAGTGGGGRDDERVMEWEYGLPGLDDLTPLSQALIPPELATAFEITAEIPRTLLEVNRESKNTIESIRSQFSMFNETNINNNFKSFGEEEGNNNKHSLGGLVSKNDGDSNNNCSDNIDNSSIMCDDMGSVKTSKRPRLVWTPQLHKRFVDVVAHLGIKNAVPKTIMTLMNVEGLTRENVASHLQKYRLYLKRMRGMSDEGPSACDSLFASTPVPRSLCDESNGGGSAAGHVERSNGNGHIGMPIPMHYPLQPPHMMHMSYIGMAGNGHGHLGMHSGNAYHGYEARHQYNMMQTSFPQYHIVVTHTDN